MTSKRLLSDAYKNHSLLFVVVALFLGNCYAKTSPNCVSYCGNIHNISHPFRVKGDPENCGNKKYELECDHNRLVLNLFSSAKYYVQAINYGNYTIRIVDVGLQHGNCSSLPLYSLSYLNFTIHKQKPYSSTLYSPDGGAFLNQWDTAVALWVDCEKPVKKSPFYTDINSSASSCIGKATSSSSPSLSSGEKRHYSYFLFGYNLGGWDVADQCKIDEIVMSTLRWPDSYVNDANFSFSDFLSGLEYGFELSWLPFFCENCREQWRYCEVGSNYSVTCRKYPSCYDSSEKSRSLLCRLEVFGNNYFAPGYKAHGFTIIGGILGARTTCGILCLLAFLIYKFRRRHLSMFDTVEGFLQSQNNLMPIRYSYSQIKKMSRGFKDKLGEGGYGSVYKGKLRSGYVAAIKILGKPKLEQRCVWSYVCCKEINKEAIEYKRQFNCYKSILIRIAIQRL